MGFKLLALTPVFLLLVLTTEGALPIRDGSIGPLNRHDLQPRSASYRWVKRDEPQSAPPPTGDAQKDEADLLEEESPGQVETGGQDAGQPSPAQQVQPESEPEAEPEPKPPIEQVQTQAAPNQQQVVSGEQPVQPDAGPKDSSPQEAVQVEGSAQEADQVEGEEEQVTNEEPKVGQVADNQQPPQSAAVQDPTGISQQQSAAPDLVAPTPTPPPNSATDQQAKDEEGLTASEEEKAFTEEAEDAEKVKTVEGPAQVANTTSSSVVEAVKDQLPTGPVSHEPLQTITTDDDGDGARPPESQIQAPAPVVNAANEPTNSTPTGEVGAAQASKAEVKDVVQGAVSVPVEEKETVEGEKETGAQKVLTNQIPLANSGRSPEQAQLAEESLFSYQIDPVSCSPDQLNLPGPILNMTVERILSRLNNQPNCTGKLDLEFHSVVNKRIKGYVMEVSSMPIEWGEFFGEAGSTRPLVSCDGKAEQVKANETATGDQSAPKTRFNLKFVLTAPDRWLASKWRRYARLHIDDLPLQMFGRSDGQRQERSQIMAKQTLSSGGGSNSGKCEKFKFQTGDFQLLLSEHQVELLFQVTLAKLDEHAYASALEFGGQIEVSSLKLVNDLYLEHKISVDEANRDRLTGLASPTVQILHDHDNHYRRNNWLMDMYGNWLRHEYRAQLTKLFTAKLVQRLSSVCFE